MVPISMDVRSISTRLGRNPKEAAALCAGLAGRAAQELPAKRNCREAAMELRYMGFEQNRNTRTYKFDGVANGQPTVHFAVTADLALFLLNRIGIQEGPT